MSWMQFVVTFVSGGFMGAIVKIAWDVYQDRLPALYRHVQIDRIFSSAPTVTAIRVTVFANGVPHDFDNLSLVTITIKNRSRTNFPKFDFGITLTGRHEIISVDWESTDRHHKGTITGDVPVPSKPLRCSDLQLYPLNRKDKYILHLLVHSVGESVKLDEVKISSSAPVKWVNVDQRITDKRDTLIAAFVASLVAGGLIYATNIHLNNTVTEFKRSMDRIQIQQDRTQHKLEALDLQSEQKDSQADPKEFRE